MTDTAQARLSRDPSPSWLDNIRRRYFPTPIQSAISVIGLGLLVFDDPPKSQASRAMVDRRPDGKGTDR